MKGISKKEIEIIALLEFNQKHFFTSEDIDKFSKNKKNRYNIIGSLIRKKRIIKLNRNKYYLIPIRAKSGSWIEHPFIIADEACNSENYFIGGWASANYWKLTEQVPMQIDVFTTRRQGIIRVLNTKVVFHRTTKKRIENSEIRKIGEHPFRIENKRDSKAWLRLRN